MKGSRSMRFFSGMLWLAVGTFLLFSLKTIVASGEGKGHPVVKPQLKKIPLFSRDPVLSVINKARRALPGMTKRAHALGKKMAEAYLAKGKSYRPRTHHFDKEGYPSFMNRLIFETSPYLIQHAHNPVNWYSWGKAAFERARRENKPVLLSVGYSTCHWCHVMERESFENKKIAAYMNQHYIAIKVDREERTDVDGIYMRVVQMLTGSGGWPMTVWLTADRQPFSGGTYFPPKDRWGRKGFLSTLRAKFEQFRKKPAEISSRSAWLIRQLRSRSKVLPTPGVPPKSVLNQAARIYSRNFDSKDGGMRGRPKFPSSFGNAFLLRYHRRTKDPHALLLASTTLEKMARGGIYDQVAGGFHRYSVDSRWLVPHFEKMLYDNAQLAVVYLDGYLVSKRKEFARITEEILDYVIREMTTSDGVFFSATDADSEGHEGKFFVWRPSEIEALLGKKDATWFQAYYGVTSRGNFEGKNILNVPKDIQIVAKSLKTTPKELWTVIQKSRKKLYVARKKRIPPLCDTKIITSWNALMITAFAKASFVLKQPKYAKVAAKAAQFLLDHVRKKGRLFRTFKQGRVRHNAYLEDYSFLIAGLLDLFEVTQEKHWLKEALSLQKVLDRFYWDSKRGGYFRTSKDHEKLLIRPKPLYDGAVPTGNSIEVLNLLRLYELTSKTSFREKAIKSFRAFGQRLSRRPLALSEMLQALDFYHDKPKQIVLIKPNDKVSIEPFLKILRENYLPNRVLVVTVEGLKQAALTKLLPLVKKKLAKKGKVTAYVCLGQVCELPTNQPKVFAKQIRRVDQLSFPKLK